MSDKSVILINLLKAKPGQQAALIALLKQNTETVIRTLQGWKTRHQLAALEASTRLRAALTDAERADTAVTLLIDHSGAKAALQAFPRSASAGYVVFGAGAAWFLYNIWNLSKADFGHGQPHFKVQNCTLHEFS